MIKNRKSLLLIALVAVFAISAAACKKGGSGKPTDTIIGSWKIDIDALKEQPMIKKQLEKAKGMAEMMLKMFEEMTLEVTKSEMTFSMKLLGQEKKESAKYTIVSEKGNELTIETDNGKKKETGMITVLDDDHITLKKGKGGMEPDLTFERK